MGGWNLRLCIGCPWVQTSCSSSQSLNAPSVLNVTRWAECYMEGNMGDLTEYYFSDSWADYWVKYTCLSFSGPLPVPFLLHSYVAHCSSLKCWGTVVAGSLISDLQPVGCLPCGKMFYFCPAWAAEENKTRTNSQKVLEWWCICYCLRLRSFVMVAQPTCSDSFCRRCSSSCSISATQFEPDHVSSSDSSAFLITAWSSYVQKATAGQCESCSLSTSWFFLLQRCISVHNSALFPFSPSTSPVSKTAEWQREANSEMAFFLLNLYWKSQVS